MKRPASVQAYLIFVIFTVLFNLAVLVGFIWLAGSIITSAVKAGTNQCDKTYPVENLVKGDWFCAKDQSTRSH